MIAAILLAAGRSRRMGAFKPLLPFGDETVIEACIRHLLAGGVEEVVVVVGHRADEVRAQLAQLPVRFAVNEEAESEMGVSIARGVEALSDEAEAVFIALADQPAIPPEAVRRLLDERQRKGASLLIPVHEGRGGHPVLIDLKYRAELLRLDPQSGLRAFFRKHRAQVLRLPVSFPGIARDMDTWDDYRSLYRESFGSEPPGCPTV
ncbi:MAG: nucleotidyltransferase family protein [Acidobacteria bacterium]|nr:nucleotidyltransferase family protein [Acidobacteriota bacterium]